MSQAPTQPFLSIAQLSKSFDEVTAVNNVSIDIAQGTIFALLGASGCGKSTLLRMLAGFEKPSSGKIFLAGKDITPIAPYDRPINMMFQSYALFPHLTVWDNIAFGLKRDDLPAAEIEARVAEMLELTQLKPFVKRKPHQLSGGQQQRVALARSLAKRPQLLLLDEPLGALDKKLREETQIELVNILRRVGVTCVMVTHDQEEAMTMADYIAVMQKGEFLQVGSPRSLYETPQSRYVADFIGNVNLLDGNVSVDEADHVVVDCADSKVYVSHGITGEHGMDVSVAIRPEKISIQKTAPTVQERENAAEDGYNCIRGVVKTRAYFGSYTIYHLQTASGAVLKINMMNSARHDDIALAEGDTAYAWFDGSDVVVLTQ